MIMDYKIIEIYSNKSFTVNLLCFHFLIGTTQKIYIGFNIIDKFMLFYVTFSFLYIFC